MNIIPRPILNDNEALQSLSNNRRLSSYPSLKDSVEVIGQGYDQYIVACGNAFHIARVDIPPEVEDHLKAHYRAPPKDLKHIIAIREDTEHLACPMCGSLHRGTLDHVLPQRQYPAFAIFSLNLVPACKCNSKRQDILLGQNDNERILHPYFDECLRDRLVRANFEDLGAIPKVDLRVCVESTHGEYAAIAFHVRSIVERTAVVGYQRDRWIDLCRKPSLVVRRLKENPTTLIELRQLLEEELDMLDDTHRSKNNWNSMFVAGLLMPNVLAWLFGRMHAPGRLPNDPLV